MPQQSSAGSAKLLRKLFPKPLVKEVRSDLIRAMVFAVFLYALHFYLDRQPAGEHLRRFQFELLQEGLKTGSFGKAEFEAGGERLPLVIDISRIHYDKSKPTNRDSLDDIITELRRARAKAIGIDLDFAASGSDELAGEDFHYLAKWQEYEREEGAKVRVGVFRRAVMNRDGWLGRPEFSELAAGIAVPKDDTLHAFLYSRRLDTSKEDSETPKRNTEQDRADCLLGGDCLIQLPAALLFLAEGENRTRSFLGSLLKRSRVRDRPDDPFQFGEYVVDYSFISELNKEIISIDSAKMLALFETRVRNRVVLVGDLQDLGDQFCALPQQKPISGVLVHACSVATLNRGMLMEVGNSTGNIIKLLLLLLIFAIICGIRVFEFRTRPKIKRNIDPQYFQYIEILAYGTMAIIVYLVCKWQIRMFGIFWLDFLWVSAALFLHPFLTEPFYRTCKAVPEVVRAFVRTFTRG